MPELLPSLDLMLRGAACGLLILVAGLLVRDHRQVTAARFGALLALSAVGFALCTTVALRGHLGLLTLPAQALMAGGNLAFWLFARAMFEDGFRPRAWHAAAWLGIVAVGLYEARALGPEMTPIAIAVRGFLVLESLGLGLLAAGQTLASWPADLVEPRRRARPFVVGAAAGFIALNALSDLLGPRATVPDLASLIRALALAIIALGVAAALLRVAGQGWLSSANPAASVRPVEPADQGLAAALDRAMSIDRAYRQEGLTIGKLAERLGAAEYRLRRLINSDLGQRNFNAYLNGYRIDETKAALADRGQDSVPILTIALDAGFNSLGPFNRAFRAETGMTPTDFRRASADSGIGQPDFEPGERRGA
ncbi:helix-turn-helix transcriptional regulator [Phenylobacterium sp. 20VBR1]|uniref:Helix-turn-helix transcriptional regulator n=1 Tax=Phenylobacterium glaciei TaxID=2803784 RepID=A0A941D0G7_9CAUL|nr:AraC family transcriptional regulator [Phenylobacterium glaciei]MBR7618628.1 helix-turn-helix transcriptional regulator [Phenylobacterium glaciei]